MVENPDENLYPPGIVYILSYKEPAGWDGKDRIRRRKPKIFPGNFFTRKLGVKWDPRDIDQVKWHLSIGDFKCFETIKLSPWLLSDHMLSTIGEGLDALQLEHLDSLKTALEP